MRVIEVCCGNVEKALEAFGNGAGRIEFCRALEVDGLTPEMDDIRYVLERCPGIAMNVLIRPKEGDFVYDNADIEEMERDIRLCKSAGVNGVVWGALTPGGDVDMKTCGRLMKASAGLSTTFHRAFDVCRDPFMALEQIISLGCDRILTSGQGHTAMDGRELLRDLVDKASGRIIIMPGGGVRPDNIDEIERFTGATEFHGTALTGIV